MHSALAALGERIRFLRLDQSLTLEELATRCGLTPNALGNIERGQVAARISTLFAVAGSLGTTAGNLLRGIDPFRETKSKY